MPIVKPQPTEPGVLDARSDQFYAAVLGALGAPANETNLDVLRAWQAAEGGSARWNPWNDTVDSGAPGQTDYNTFGKDGRMHVRNYPTAEAGLSATVGTLQAPAYRGIVAGLRASNPTQTVSALVNSPWDGGYGAKGKRGQRDYSTSTVWQVFQRVQQTQGPVAPRVPGYRVQGADYTAQNTGTQNTGGFSLNPFGPVATLVETLTTGAFWIRVGLIAGGLGLVILAVVLIGKDAAARVVGSQVTGAVRGALGKLGASGE